MLWWEIIEMTELGETMSLVESWCLEVKGIEPDSNAALFTRDVFRHIH
ncbi:hypothetical protein M770_31095 (plasmid) [Pseudomonas aeruginosa VRFPA03]|nr:hypothetical protein M770_31095 [Pseudomonas aeruginosa VRFPA03]